MIGGVRATGGVRAKKRDFFIKIFQKVPKNAFCWPVFSKLCLRRRKFGENGIFLFSSDLGELITCLTA